jgi:hypothetical protein
MHNVAEKSVRQRAHMWFIYTCFRLKKSEGRDYLIRARMLTETFQLSAMRMKAARMET